MATEPNPDRRQARVPAHLAGVRLDRFLADCFPNYSRRQLSDAVKAGLVCVNDHKGKPGQILAANDRLDLPVWSKTLPGLEKKRESERGVGRAPTEIVELYRDDDLLIVAKPPGLPVHAGAGISTMHTLIESLREDVLAGFGLVHRLDKDTTGAIALVRGEEMRRVTSERFADPAGGVIKIYEAIVSGVPEPAEDEIEAPLLPPSHGGRARVDDDEGRPALTRYRTLESFVRAARLEIELETGRTHQIRVHLRHRGYPLLVDPIYGTRKAWRIPDPRGRRDVYLSRTPLHARRLELPHPRTGQRISVDAPVPDDMKHTLEVLRVVASRGRIRGGLPLPPPPEA
ncbi:MAG: RluA family pseudouridine synthase [Planctomycetota bacterium]|nr:RluA family pseudouridine synthase [Planctomycetota bacterium]